MKTARELLWILANRCYINHLDWREADVITLDLDSRREDDKEVLESLQKMGQLIAYHKEAGKLDDETVRSCHTCEYRVICFLHRSLINLLSLPAAHIMLDWTCGPDTPRTQIHKAVAEACREYQKEQEAET